MTQPSGPISREMMRKLSSGLGRKTNHKTGSFAPAGQGSRSRAGAGPVGTRTGNERSRHSGRAVAASGRTPCCRCARPCRCRARASRAPARSALPEILLSPSVLLRPALMVAFGHRSLLLLHTPQAGRNTGCEAKVNPGRPTTTRCVPGQCAPQSGPTSPATIPDAH